MNPLYEFDDMVDYLEGRMSESDRTAFEQALQSDAALAARLEALQSEAKVNRLLREEYLLEQFAEWEKEERRAQKPANHPGQGGKVVAFRRWIIPAGIAASLIGLICIGWLFHWFGNPDRQADITATQPNEEQKTPPEHTGDAKERPHDSPAGPNTGQQRHDTRDAAYYAALADSAYIDEDFTQALMGADEPEKNESAYARAAKRYSMGRYEEALKLLERPDRNQLEEYLYLRAYTHYRLKQYDKAEADFRAFRNFPVSDRKLDAQWCEVFCLVRQLPASRKRLDSLLTSIQSSPGPYSERAAALQQTLQRK